VNRPDADVIQWLGPGDPPYTKLILDVQLFGRHGTDPAAAFLQGLYQRRRTLAEAITDGSLQEDEEYQWLTGRIEAAEREVEGVLTALSPLEFDRAVEQLRHAAGELPGNFDPHSLTDSPSERSQSVVFREFDRRTVVSSATHTVLSEATEHPSTAADLEALQQILDIQRLDDLFELAVKDEREHQRATFSIGETHLTIALARQLRVAIKTGH